MGKEGTKEKMAQAQHAGLHHFVEKVVGQAGGYSSSTKIPGAPLRPEEGSGKKHGDVAVYGIRDQPFIVDGANVSTETVDEQFKPLLRTGEIKHARAVTADIGRDDYVYVPKAVTAKEEEKRASSVAAYARIHMGFVPVVVSQRGVMGSDFRDLLLELAQHAAKKPPVLKMVGARSEVEGAMTDDPEMVQGGVRCRACPPAGTPDQRLLPLLPHR